jgi:hypothetical protein
VLFVYFKGSQIKNGVVYVEPMLPMEDSLFFFFFEKNSFSFYRIQEQKLLQLQGKP